MFIKILIIAMRTRLKKIEIRILCLKILTIQIRNIFVTRFSCEFVLIVHRIRNVDLYNYLHEFTGSVIRKTALTI